MHLWLIQEHLRGSVWIGKCKDGRYPPQWRREELVLCIWQRLVLPIYLTAREIAGKWHICREPEEASWRKPDYKSPQKINGSSTSSMVLTMKDTYSCKANTSTDELVWPQAQQWVPGNCAQAAGGSLFGQTMQRVVLPVSVQFTKFVTLEAQAWAPLQLCQNLPKQGMMAGWSSLGCCARCGFNSDPIWLPQ